MYYSYKATLRNLANKELKVTSFSSDSLLQEHEKGLTAGFELYTKSLRSCSYPPDITGSPFFKELCQKSCNAVIN